MGVQVLELSIMTYMKEKTGLLQRGSCGLFHDSVFVRHTFARVHPPRADARGFTLLLAVLLGSLLFSMGIAIVNLTLKELMLSTAARNSEHAFYAADSGIECALFWDLNEGKTFPADNGDKDRRDAINCGGEDITLDYEETKTAATTTFIAEFSSPGFTPRCAEVVVGKVAKQGAVPERVVIESRGRNLCGDDDNPARVERALRVRY